jgi:transposase
MCSSSKLGKDTPSLVCESCAEIRRLSSGCITFFASRLKYSRYIRVRLVKDETVESLVRSLAEHLDSWGGAPLVCVFDRPKTVALKWRRNGEVTEWNSVFAYATLEMGIGVELCWPYRP